MACGKLITPLEMCRRSATVGRKRREMNRPASGPEIKCLSRMITAIDALRSPMLSLPEKLRLVEFWRQEERRLHADSAIGRNVAELINVNEIDTILRTRKFREAAKNPRSGVGVKLGDDVDDAGPEWVSAGVSRGGARLPRDTVTGS
jgi:hypothetical protein